MRWNYFSILELQWFHYCWFDSWEQFPLKFEEKCMHGNEFENIMCERAAILSRPQFKSIQVSNGSIIGLMPTRIHFQKHWWTSFRIRADSRFVPSQWETALLCNGVSHWLGASLEPALWCIGFHMVMRWSWPIKVQIWLTISQNITYGSSSKCDNDDINGRMRYDVYSLSVHICGIHW